jgi:hypothetical protein
VHPLAPADDPQLLRDVTCACLLLDRLRSFKAWLTNSRRSPHIQCLHLALAVDTYTANAFSDCNFAESIAQLKALLAPCTQLLDLAIVFDLFHNATISFGGWFAPGAVELQSLTIDARCVITVAGLSHLSALQHLRLGADYTSASSTPPCCPRR